MSEAVKIPHDGRKPAWLEDDALISHIGLFGRPVRASAIINWRNGFGDPFFLPSDHWAAPVLLAALTPWNPKLQGEGPPKDYAGGKVMFSDHSVGDFWPVSGRVTHIPIGYERRIATSAEIIEQGNDPKIAAAIRVPGEPSPNPLPEVSGEEYAPGAYWYQHPDYGELVGRLRGGSFDGALCREAAATIATLSADLAEAVKIAQMVCASSMSESRPSRGESSIGWQKGDKADASSIRHAARAFMERIAKP